MSANKLFAVILFVAIFGCIQAQEDQIQFRYYFGSNQWRLYNIQTIQNILNEPSFDSGRDVVFYHYGFSQTENSDNVREVIDAYVIHGNANFILIFYDNLTTNTVVNARSLGNALGAAYVRLCDGGVNPARLHLIGFSLGAQIQAIASRTVQSSTNRRHVVGRLTGLDPGQLSDTTALLTGRISSADANFVDTIHTESVGLGDFNSVGHVAFRVNGGVRQPFCTSGIQTIAQACSHNFAPSAWAESIRHRAPSFPSLQCTNWDAFLANSCNSAAPVGNMGQFAASTLRNEYFLRTNNQSPFSRPNPGP